MKDHILRVVDAHLDEIFEITKFMYDNPELGNEEFKACQALCESFKKHGFEVEREFCGIPTAFKASFDSGKPGPTIGFCAEYDALPGVGHGCGHNLISTSALLGAIALKSVLGEIGGKVEVYGTPAEETDGAKAAMADQNAFSGCSVVLMAHPAAIPETSGSSMCLMPITFRFYGKAAHASACPEEGINALDAVIQLYNGINAIRQHVPNDTQFHGVITNGGVAANIVPDFAEAQFYCRAKRKATAEAGIEKMIKIAEGAALMTGARMEHFRHEAAYYDLATNKALCEVFVKHQREMGENVRPAGKGNGSLDLGNVSYQAPCVHGWFGFEDPNLVVHSKEFADRTVTEDGRQMLKRSAATMALTGVDVITDPELLKNIILEFEAI